MKTKGRLEVISAQLDCLLLELQRIARNQEHPNVGVTYTTTDGKEGEMRVYSKTN